MKLGTIVGVLLIATAALSQVPSPVPPLIDTCVLATNGAPYADQRVSIHGLVTHRNGWGGIRSDGHLYPFELFIEAAHCPEREGMWISFDLQNANTQLGPGAKRLEDLLNARRLFTPSGNLCGVECSYYKVSATVTGKYLFFGTAEKPWGILVIESASDFDLFRTEIPFGGSYDCTEDTWEPTPDEFNALDGKTRLEYYSRIAERWHDPAVLDPGLQPKDLWRWRSPDDLRSYSVSELTILKGNVHVGTISRELCHPKAGHEPLNVSGEIRCAQPLRFTSQAKSLRLNLPTSSLEESARASVLKIADQQKLQAPTLIANRCIQLADEHQDEGWCSFTSEDGTVSASVTLTRNRSTSKNKRSLWKPWKAIDAEFTFCSISE